MGFEKEKKVVEVGVKKRSWREKGNQIGRKSVSSLELVA